MGSSKLGPPSTVSFCPSRPRPSFLLMPQQPQHPFCPQPLSLSPCLAYPWKKVTPYFFLNEKDLYRSRNNLQGNPRIVEFDPTQLSSSLRCHFRLFFRAGIQNARVLTNQAFPRRTHRQPVRPQVTFHGAFCSPPPEQRGNYLLPKPTPCRRPGRAPCR